MSCYRQGGCGPYQTRSCYECPASKPEYAERYKSIQRTCKDCDNFIGGGDWNLCCKEEHEGYPCGFLCYENSPVCEKFKPIK